MGTLSPEIKKSLSDAEKNAIDILALESLDVTTPL
jgi:hypothetical protein